VSIFAPCSEGEGHFCLLAPGKNKNAPWATAGWLERASMSPDTYCGNKGDPLPPFLREAQA
jgi:hypothetical protein